MVTETKLSELSKKLVPTLVFESRKLSTFLGFPLLVASETLQHTGSFKFRAALNVVLNGKSDHFVTISSGNFGQALAYASKLEGKKCTVLMPETSAQVKIDAVRQFGASIELVDTTKRSRDHWLENFVAKCNEKLDVVSPYDDDRVIDGNSTLADELARIRPHKEFDCVVSPIGGGGLISGIIKGLKNCNSNVEVIGAEPVIANDAARSLKEGSLQRNSKEPMTIADGVRTLSLGERNWAIIKPNLKTIIEVEEEAIKEAVKL